MRVVMIGGTRFVGRALARELREAGHEVLFVHRGVHEARELAGCKHLHADRRELSAYGRELAAFKPDALVDSSAMTAADADAVLGAVRGDLRFLVVSSIDVYRAFSAVWSGAVVDPVPLDEESPLRAVPPPDAQYVTPGYDYEPAAYEKLDVERAYRARGGVVCRLPMVYGPHDYKRREEFILARVRAGRREIPVGAGSWLWSRGHAAGLAMGMRLALESEQAVGHTFNLCEATCASVRLWMEQILAAAESDAELVRVPDESLPDDLEITGDIPQHWLCTSAKARQILGWIHPQPETAVLNSVRWHLDHPGPAVTDFTADDDALAGTAA